VYGTEEDAGEGEVEGKGSEIGKEMKEIKGRGEEIKCKIYL
jgi:hypothetical protein